MLWYWRDYDLLEISLGCAYKSSLPFSILVATEVFSWGSGTNYQLGTGNAHIQSVLLDTDVQDDQPRGRLKFMAS